MPEQVTVIATMKVMPAEVEQALEILRGVIESSHGEDGCVKYTLHRSTNEAGAFSIVEVWRSQEDLDAHFKQPHMAPIAQALEMLTEPPQILFCAPVAVGDATKGTL
jgi:quinol monooxygenase YgiN